jgi:opacity protein-like surface antigen
MPDERPLMDEILGTPDSMRAHRVSLWCTVTMATRGVVLGFCLVLGVLSVTIAADDSYIAGYAAAVLEHEFNIPGAIVQVQGGVVVVTAASLGKVDRQKVIAMLETIPGVVRAEVREGVPSSPVPPVPSQAVVQQEVPKPESKFLPRGLLVAPFHADPRWPHFSMASRHLSLGQEPNHTGSANFGETFALYRNAAALDGQWEIAIQAGVFSVFNMNAGSTDLVNADYTVGLLTSYRTGPFSGFLRLHHQSSHLGDEFILNSRPPVNRVNVSFEEVDLKLSYELVSWFRIYGGGGILIGARDPNDLPRGTSQVGAELTTPWTLWDGKVRPVAYTDIQINARSNWRVGSSVMAGLQFENAGIGDRKLQVLAEYFGGPSPDGQFFTQHTEWFGVGVHLYY